LTAAKPAGKPAKPARKPAKKAHKPAKKAPTGARHPRGREVPNDGRPSPGARSSPARQDPLKDGADTTVATGPANHAVHLLQSEHRTVSALFDQVAAKPALAADIRGELERHARLEEEIFYPAVAAIDAEGMAAIRDARAQHEDIRRALADSGPPLDARSLAALRQVVERHVEFEENVVFAAALRALSKDDLVALAERMEQRNRQLGGTLAKAGRGTRK
jgi:hypothetical protein